MIVLENWPPLGALAALLLCVSGCKETPEIKSPPRLVLTAVVGSEAAKREAFPGTIEPRYRTDLGFRVAGRMIARDVEVGDLVKKGQRVAALDPTALEFAVRSQRAALANAQANLVNAAGNEERQRTLRDRDVTAQSVFETSEQGRIAAEAGVTQAQSNLAKAQEQLGYAELRSDFDGVVTGIGAEIGQVVGGGQTIVTVARPDVREAAVSIPEVAGLDIVVGTNFDVALQLDETVHTRGTIREIAPEADAVTRSRRALITLEAPPDQFRLGSTVTVRLIKGAAERSSVRLPASALIERDGKAWVLIVHRETSVLVETPVTVGLRKDDAVLVAGDLPPETRVVIAGVKSLKAGDAVRLEVGANPQ